MILYKWMIKVLGNYAMDVYFSKSTLLLHDSQLKS